MRSIMKFFTLCFLAFILSFAVLAAPSAVTAGDTAAEQIPDAESGDEETLLFAGEGTATSPYLISSTSDFNNFSNYINKAGSDYADKYYKLTANIDFSNSDLIPFGVSAVAPFKGTLDGDGYALLNVSVPDKECSGVVGYMSEGVVKNLRVAYADMTQYKTYSNLKYFGGIVGHSLVDNTKIDISGCATEGNLMLDFSAAAYAGGIFGHLKCNSGNGIVSNSVSNINLNIKSKKEDYVAGFVGYAVASSTNDFVFTNCFSYGDVTVLNTGDYSSRIAGFCAYANKDESGWSGWAGDEASLMASNVSHFKNCVAYGDVLDKSNSIISIGGFIGHQDGAGKLIISNCYEASVITAESGTVTVNSFATETTKDNINNKDFVKNVVGLDFERDMYMSYGKVEPRATAKSYGSAEALENKDVRLTYDPGIRFRSVIEASKRDYVFEYGFIVTRVSLLGSQELTHDFTGKKIIGAAYDEKNGVDKFLSKEDFTIEFSAVIFNIKEEYYSEEFAVRPYVKFVNGDETVIVYGNMVTSSLNDSALAVKGSENYHYLTESQKTLLETMLPKA